MLQNQDTGVGKFNEKRTDVDKLPCSEVQPIKTCPFNIGAKEVLLGHLFYF